MLSLFVLAALLATPTAPQGDVRSSWADRARSLASAIFNDESRYYLQVGGITSGAGISAGPGIRLKDLAGGRLDLDARAIVSHRKYLLAEAAATTPLPVVRGLRAGPFVRRAYFPQEDFFGIGPASRRENRVNYAFDETAGGLVARFERDSPLIVDARIEYRAPDVGPGDDDSYPSIEERYPAAALAGLSSQPDFLVATTSVTYEGAEPRGHPLSGGRYEASLSRFWGRGSSASDFAQLNVDLREYLPVVPDRQIIALRGAASLTATPAGADVPFYYLPWLGGAKSLRGFRELQFHDRNTLLFQAEYRWLPKPFIETAVFYDVGAVAQSLSHMGRDHVLSDYGVGVRFGTASQMFFRLEAAFGGDQSPRVFAKFSGGF